MFFSTSKLAALAAAAPLINALPFQGTEVVKRGGFSANANNNVAVWWGNSDKTNSFDLAKTCADSNVDIVILTFATSINGDNVVVGGGAESTSLGSTIKQCQSAGKKVLMSIGGATGTIKWTDTAQAQAGAKAVAKQFLSADGMYKVALDGIDLDIETADSKGWSDFTKALRSEMKDGQYITGAPQCPSPDASLPFDVLNQMDFVWVQFYNNGPCNHGASGFEASVKDWSSKLTKPKLYIATPGSQGSAGSGYISAADITKEIASVKAMNLKNFGGYAIWDASTAALNDQYEGAIKKALGGNSGAANPPSGSSSSAAAGGPSASASTTHRAQTNAPTVTGSAVTVKATSTAHVTSTAVAAGPTGSGKPASAASPSASSKPSATGSASTPAQTGSSGSANAQPCSDAGKIVCGTSGTSFGICDGTQAVMMAVSQGTVCQGGSIVAVDSGASATGSAPSTASNGPPSYEGDDNEDSE